MIISTNPLDKLKKHRETSREIRKGFSKYPRNLVILFCLLLCSFEKPRGSSHQRTIKQIVHFNFTALVLQGKWKLCSSVCKSSRCLLPSCSYFSHSQWCSANPSGLNSGVTSYPSRSSPEHQHHQPSNDLHGILTVRIDCVWLCRQTQEATLWWHKRHRTIALGRERLNHVKGVMSLRRNWHIYIHIYMCMYILQKNNNKKMMFFINHPDLPGWVKLLHEDGTMTSMFPHGFHSFKPLYLIVWFLGTGKTIHWRVTNHGGF